MCTALIARKKHIKLRVISTRGDKVMLQAKYVLVFDGRKMHAKLILFILIKLHCLLSIQAFVYQLINIKFRSIRTRKWTRQDHLYSINTRSVNKMSCTTIPGEWTLIDFQESDITALFSLLIEKKCEFFVCISAHIWRCICFLMPRWLSIIAVRGVK